MDKIGYSCECDPNYFVGERYGKLCYESGAEIIIKITGRANGDSTDRDTMIILRSSIMTMLMQENYIHTGSGYAHVDIALLEEGVKDYVIDEDSTMLMTVNFERRKIWSIVIRVATVYLDMSLISNADIFDQYDTFTEKLMNLNPSMTTVDYLVHRMKKCSNDNSRS